MIYFTLFLKQVEELQAENAKLRKEIEALRLRFGHLINNQPHDVAEYYKDDAE